MLKNLYVGTYPIIFKHHYLLLSLVLGIGLLKFYPISIRYVPFLYFSFNTIHIVLGTFDCASLHRFQCENKKCVPRYQVCDGVDNCGDGSDENNMTLCAAKFKPCVPALEFQCANKKCIDRDKVCDYGDDCGDTSDERGCRKFLLTLEIGIYLVYLVHKS